MKESLFILRLSLCFILLVVLRGRRALKLNSKIFQSWDGIWLLCDTVCIGLPPSTCEFQDPTMRTVFTIICAMQLYLWVTAAERGSSWVYILCASVMMQRSYFALRFGRIHSVLFALAFRLLWLTTGVQTKDAKATAKANGTFIV
ncbi:MAG: hypothetical protein CL967_05700 [Euryarchaeota archaeon]|nr:hypothetical protein [Euryarchaeota archaeon]